MTPPLALPQATRRGGFRHPGCSFLPVLGLNALVGLPAYFCAFLFAYGFRDSVGWSEHVAFLGMIALYSVPTGVVALTWAAHTYQESTLPILGFGVLTSLGLNAAVVGIGSIVSAANKDQGSVSAGFSTPTDVVVAVALFGFAAACAFTAEAVTRASLSGRS